MEYIYMTIVALNIEQIIHYWFLNDSIAHIFNYLQESYMVNYNTGWTYFLR